MDNKDLENVISIKIKPMLDEAMEKFIGIKVEEISEDITDKIRRSPVLDLPIDIGVPFKQFKKNFKKQYIIRLLQLNQGNISHVADLAKVDRRSIHRIVREMKINVESFRKRSFDADYLKKAAIKDAINETLDIYKDTIKTKKLKKLYSKSSDISADIMKVIPNGYLSLEDAEKEYEKKYLRKALEEYKFNISKTARKIGLRYETLHRKLKDVLKK